MIPSGSGWAWHSMTDPADMIAATLGPARWQPTEIVAASPPGESLAADLANAARKCFDTGTLNAAGMAQQYRFDFASGQQPSELWVEFEMYMQWTRAGPFGGDRWHYFYLTDTGGREIIACNQGTSWSGLRSGTGTPLDANTHFFGTGVGNGTAWATGQWRTVRIHFTAATTPGGTRDANKIEVYSAVGSAGNGDTLTFQNELTDNGVPTHNAGPLASFSIGNVQGSTYTNPCRVQIRNLCWGTTAPTGGDGISAPTGGMTSATPWFAQCGGRCAPWVGQQTFQSAGLLTMQVHGRYDVNQIENYTTGADSVYVTMQWDTNPSFPNPSESDLFVLSDPDISRNCYSATMYDVPENTTIYVRAKFEGPVHIFYSSVTKIKTISASTPATLRFGFGSCNVPVGGLEPTEAFDRMAAQNYNYVLHIGDITYLDLTTSIGGSFPAAYVASAGTAAARRALLEKFNVRETYGASPWEKCARYSAIAMMRDDHDWQNAFGGAHATWTSGDGLTLKNEVNDVWRPLFGCQATNFQADESSSNVNYFSIKSAKTMICVLDTRMFFDRSTTVLGATQKAWLLNEIATCTKPYVVLTSGSPWRSTFDEPQDCFGGYTTERNAIFAALQANANITKVVLLSSDRHYTAVNKAEFAAWPKIYLEFTGGPFNQYARNPATYESGTNVFQTAFGETEGVGVIRAWGELVINEATGQISISAVNGKTGASVYSESGTFVPSLTRTSGMHLGLRIGLGL